jgi:hypothetical protein
MPTHPLRPGVTAACDCPEAASGSAEVLELVDLNAHRIWLRLSLPLATVTPVRVRLAVSGGAEHAADGEVLLSTLDPGNPGHFTAIRFTPPLTEAVLRLFVEMTLPGPRS